mmetsp:Transcript_37172/g.55382  ORF Transcript_37172/g.55382 Transcript_37172/m.55382 type:complete len:103 (+) Transcript_37172:382-690(+)
MLVAPLNRATTQSPLGHAYATGIDKTQHAFGGLTMERRSRVQRVAGSRNDDEPERFHHPACRPPLDSKKDGMTLPAMVADSAPDNRRSRFDVGYVYHSHRGS